jgi:cysteine sulfinate desulfinase/cysteine desulfurase-like protein
MQLTTAVLQSAIRLSFGFDCSESGLDKLIDVIKEKYRYLNGAHV